MRRTAFACDSLEVICPRLSSASASALAERRLYEYRLLCANRRSLSRHTLPTAACVKIPEPQSLKWLFDGNVQRDAARSAPSSETAKARSECTYKGPLLLAFTTCRRGDDFRRLDRYCSGRSPTAGTCDDRLLIRCCRWLHWYRW